MTLPTRDPCCVDCAESGKCPIERRYLEAEIKVMVDLNKLQEMVFKEYVKNGYAERWTKEYFIAHPVEFDLLIDLAEVGLINTEVSELLEDIRSNEPERWGWEVSDIIIRALNWASRKKINVNTVLIKKHLKNMKREHLHGRTI